MSKLTRIEERIESISPSKVVRHEKGFTIKDVVLLSENSKNPGPSGKPRRYGAGLQQKVKSLFEGIKVKADHPEKNADGTPKSRERSILTTIGEAQNVRVRQVVREGRKESQIIGDLELINTPVAAHVAALAESMPKHAGMSITGDGAFAVGEGDYDDLVELIPQTVDVVDKPATTKGFFEAEGDAPAFGSKKKKVVAPKSEGDVDDEVEPADDVVTDEPTDLEDDDTELNADEQDLENDEPELDENGEPIESDGMDSENPDDVTTAANELTDIANSEKTSQAHFDAAFAHSKAAGIVYELGNVPRAKAHKDKAAEHDLKAVQLKTSEGAKAPQMPPDGKPQGNTALVDKGEAFGSKTEGKPKPAFGGAKPKPKVLESAPDWVTRAFLGEANDNHDENGRFASGDGGGSSGGNKSRDKGVRTLSRANKSRSYGPEHDTREASKKLSQSAFQTSHDADNSGKEADHAKAEQAHTKAASLAFDAAKKSASMVKTSFFEKANKHLAKAKEHKEKRIKRASMGESVLESSPSWVQRLFSPVEEYADGRISPSPEYSYSPTKSCEECAKILANLKLELVGADGAQKGYLEKAIKAFEASKEAYEDGSYSMHKDAVATHGAALARALTDDQNALHVKMVNRHANRTQESISEGNDNHDENGRFASGDGSGSSGKTQAGSDNVGDKNWAKSHLKLAKAAVKAGQPGKAAASYQKVADYFDKQGNKAKALDYRDKADELDNEAVEAYGREKRMKAPSSGPNSWHQPSKK